MRLFHHHAAANAAPAMPASTPYRVVVMLTSHRPGDWSMILLRNIPSGNIIARALKRRGGRTVN
jgi:hypothetical protein